MGEPAINYATINSLVSKYFLLGGRPSAISCLVGGYVSLWSNKVGTKIYVYSKYDPQSGYYLADSFLYESAETFLNHYDVDIDISSQDGLLRLGAHQKKYGRPFVFVRKMHKDLERLIRTITCV